jgi:hypothetical protein
MQNIETKTFSNPYSRHKDKNVFTFLNIFLTQKISLQNHNCFIDKKDLEE